jgi:acyl-CoA dehydrogenase
VNIFQEQIAALKEFLATATPDEAQRRDIDFLLSLGEMFTLVVYGQLVLENARIYGVDDDLVDQIFDFMVRDFSRYALQLYGKPSSTPEQMAGCLRMIKKPAVNPARYQRVWEEHVHALNGAYEMNP